MRTFLDLPGSNGKIKRVSNRINGDDRRRTSDDEGSFDAREPHDPRKARRESRVMMRRIVTGDDLVDFQLDD